ncbi:MAG: class I SAM-dependent methyltransferase [Phycisphaerae bacterium]
MTAIHSDLRPGGPSSGRAYEIALSLRPLLTATLGPEARPALENALRAIDKRLEPGGLGQPGFERLGDLFDIDAVISFSSAWDYWANAKECLARDAKAPPLDQELFHGRHAGATRYFEGIDRLARGNAHAIADWVLQQGVRATALLDLGAGTGVYAMAFLQVGAASHVMCVDYPFVVRSVAHRSAPGISWVSADVECPGVYAPPRSIDALWISNLLHHYSAADCVRILSACRPFLRDHARVFVHEYCLDGDDTQQLAAGILGLHFALTTGGGRCYTRRELQTIVSGALGEHGIRNELPLLNATVLEFERGVRRE